MLKALTGSIGSITEVARCVRLLVEAGVDTTIHGRNFDNFTIVYGNASYEGVLQRDLFSGFETMVSYSWQTPCSD
jgi:hypothetical protein